MDPHTKLREILIIPLATMFYGSSKVSKFPAKVFIVVAVNPL